TESARFHELSDELGGRGLALGAGDPDRPRAGQLPAHTRIGARQEGRVRRQPSSRHGGRLTSGPGRYWLILAELSPPFTLPPLRTERSLALPRFLAFPPFFFIGVSFGCVPAGRFPRGGNLQ